MIHLSRALTRREPSFASAEDVRALETLAVVLDEPRSVSFRSVGLKEPVEGDAVVQIEFSGISTGTERLLWDGRMPEFPGMGYPLVPGYEGVGRIREVNADGPLKVGDRVFVPGSNGFVDARGLFGADAMRVVTPVDRLIPLDTNLEGPDGALLALTATALHAVRQDGLPELVIGHGVLGRLVARLTIALGGSPPRVWETNPVRTGGAQGYDVMHPDEDDRTDYIRICDVSGDPGILDHAIPCLARHGQVTLAGFYSEPVHFLFPAAFQREARIRIAAEWNRDDLDTVLRMVAQGAVDLSGLITHTAPAQDAETAFTQAFEDHECLKMILDWRNTA